MKSGTVDSSEWEPRRPRAVLISASNLRRDSRVLKMAKSLDEYGYDVTLLGIVVQSDDELEERTDFARLVRARTSSVPYVSAGEDGVARLSMARSMMRSASRVRFIDDLRQFAGRLRECVILSRAALSEEPDIILVCNPRALLAGVLVKRRRRIPLVYDVREVYTGQSTDVTRLYKALYGLLEKGLAGYVDAVTAVNGFVGSELKSRARVPEPVVVMNGASECVCAHTPVARPVRLFFQGRFAADRGLHGIVRLMNRLRGRATLTLQGFEGVEAELHELVEELGLKDVVKFREPCVPWETVRCAAEYDVGVIGYPPLTPNLHFSSPNKLFDYLGGGLALASCDIPFVRNVIERYRCGVLFDPMDPESILEALSFLVNNPELVNAMKERSLVACAAMSWGVQATMLVDCFEKCRGRYAQRPVSRTTGWEGP